jgi:hypothetical protein
MPGARIRLFFEIRIAGQTAAVVWEKPMEAIRPDETFNSIQEEVESELKTKHGGENVTATGFEKVRAQGRPRVRGVPREEQRARFELRDRIVRVVEKLLANHRPLSYEAIMAGLKGFKDKRWHYGDEDDFKRTLKRLKITMNFEGGFSMHY